MEPMSKTAPSANAGRFRQRRHTQTASTASIKAKLLQSSSWI